jgi:hypothetical protein
MPNFNTFSCPNPEGSSLGPAHSASQTVTGISWATSPPSEPHTSQDEVSKYILFRASTLLDLEVPFCTDKRTV